MIYPQRLARNARTDVLFGMAQGLGANGGVGPVPFNVILKAQFVGPSGNDLVSAYTPEIGGAFTYAAAPSLAQLDGSNHALVTGTGALGSGSNRFGAWQNAGVADIPNQAQVTGAYASAVAGGATFGMLLRFIDTNNFIFIRGLNTLLRIVERFGGTEATLGSGSMSFPINTPTLMKATAKGSAITATVGGVTVSGTAQNTTGTKFGLYAEANNAALGTIKPTLANWLLY